MEITIRKATSTDYDTLCELFEEIDSLHSDNLPHIFQKPDGAPRERDYYLGLISDENIALFVAEAGNKLVGFIHAIIKDAPPIPIFVSRCYAVIDGVLVKSEFQNQGTGRMLMDKIQEWAIAKNATSIELNVFEFNQSAISFYEKLGYQTLSRKMGKALE
jgi:ribosomal protein S18 acetylase RimI-like enzyme